MEERTHFEKMKELLDEMGVKYFEYDFSIEISSESMSTYGGVGINFDKDGNFDSFDRAD